MGRGGARVGAGRRKGTVARRDQAQRAAMKANGMQPLEFLLTVMQDQSLPMPLRVDAAKAAVPYFNAKVTIQVTTAADGARPSVDPLDAARRGAFLLANGAERLSAAEPASTPLTGLLSADIHQSVHHADPGACASSPMLDSDRLETFTAALPTLDVKHRA